MLKLRKNGFIRIAAWLVAFLFSCSSAFSQANLNYAGIFPTIDHSGKLSEKWSYNAYLFAAAKPYGHTNQWNLKDKARLLYAYSETGISYNITSKLSATASYVYERQNPFEENYRNENRLFQQLTLKLPLKKEFELKQRLRFDERFIGNRLTGKSEFSHRLRYLIGAKKPLNDSWYVTGYTEFFFGTSGKVQFNENWSALQAGYAFNNIHSVEFGFLYVGWIYNNTNNWFNQYYLQMTWVSNLDFAKK